MKKAITILGIMYYIFCILVVAGTGYVVFWLHRSPWWFLAAILLIESVGSPRYKSKSDKDE